MQYAEPQNLVVTTAEAFCPASRCSAQHLQHKLKTHCQFTFLTQHTKQQLAAEQKMLQRLILNPGSVPVAAETNQAGLTAGDTPLQQQQQQ